MSEGDETPIACLRRYCAMYRWGRGASQSPLLSEVGTDFFAFAGLHLMCTMFITSDDCGHPPHGVFHRVLDPLGRSGLLDEVDRALALPVGPGTLWEYLQCRQSSLAVHGTLAWRTKPVEVEQRAFDEEALDGYHFAAKQFDAAVEELDRQLAMLEGADEPR